MNDLKKLDQFVSLRMIKGMEMSWSLAGNQSL